MYSILRILLVPVWASTSGLGVPRDVFRVINGFMDRSDQLAYLCANGGRAPETWALNAVETEHFVTSASFRRVLLDVSHWPLRSASTRVPPGFSRKFHWAPKN
jgi:hypothetical protein